MADERGNRNFWRVFAKELAAKEGVLPLRMGPLLPILFYDRKRQSRRGKKPDQSARHRERPWSPIGIIGASPEDGAEQAASERLARDAERAWPSHRMGTERFQRLILPELADRI